MESLQRCAVLSLSVMSDSLQPCGLQPIRLLCAWGFSRQEYWSGLPYPPPGDLPNPGIEPRPPTLQANSLLSEPPGKPYKGVCKSKRKRGKSFQNQSCVAVGEGCSLQPNTHQPHSPSARSGLLSQRAFRGQRGLLKVLLQLSSVGQVRRVWRVWTGK